MQSSTESVSKKIIVGTLITILILLLIGVAFGGTYAYMLLNDKNIAKGVYINGINVGGLSKEHALQVLKDKYDSVLDRTITIHWKNKIDSLKLSQLGASYDYDTVINKAYSIGRGKGIIKSLQEIYDANKNKVNLSLNMALDDSKIDSYLKEVEKSVYIPAKNAKLTYNGSFNVIPHMVGEKLNVGVSKKLILDAINNNKDSVTLPIENIMPKYTTEFFKKVNTKISSFSTRFNTEQVNRSENLAVAAKAINGTILMPGDIFSLNKTLGPRIASNGYKSAPVIVDGKTIDDYGGGVCQIATTLYNAVVRADLGVTERTHHQYPVSYIPAGQDATIAGDWFDLKFKNTSKYPIYIKSYISGDRFYVELYGDNYMNGLTVDLESKVVKIIPAKTIYVDDNKLPQGKYVVERSAHDGMIVDVYKHTYKNGKLISTEKLHTDNYEVVNAIVRRGVKK